MSAAISPTGLLGLAAAPTFAVMALVSGLSGSGGEVAALCGSLHGSSVLGGMGLMYVLMAVFHLPPWLKWLSCRWRPE